MLKLALLNIAIFQGIVFSFILLNSLFFRNKANKYLAFAMLSLSWSLFNLVLDMYQVFNDYPILKIVDILDSAVLFPVLILLFISHQLNHSFKRSKHLFWLFIPFLLSLFYSIFMEIQTKAEENFIGNALGVFILLITFIFVPYILIKTYSIIQSSEDKQQKKWLIYLWGFEMIFMTSWLLTIMSSLFIDYNVENIMQNIALFSTLLIHWIAYLGVYKLKLANDQKQIRALLLNKTKQAKTITSETRLPAKTNSNSSITTSKKDSPTQENHHYEALKRLCEKQKIYRDSTLDRNKVAQMLGISPSYVSQITNSKENENFSTFINRYRVEEVKKLIIDKEFEKYSLLSIGLESGFSSKTTYYNWFKKITGMTPNAYKKSMNKF